MGSVRLCLALFVLSVFFPPASVRAGNFPLPEAEGIETNAREGQFASNQKFWFSVPSGERLRLLVDGAERYSGGGSASLELDAGSGEERRFLITAERRSPPPLDGLLETRDFSVTIDKRPPGTWKSEDGAVFFREEGITIAALADFGDRLVYFPDLSSAVIPPFPFNALIWASDDAGNFSVPVPHTFDFPGVRVENPVPGVWANPQRLVISGAGGGEIFWTDDGSDPLGPGGKRYRGPVPINRTGDVTLRVASPRFPAGETINYTVTGPDTGTGGGKEEIFAFLRSLEEREIREEVSLPVPSGFLWSMGGTPDQSPSRPFSPEPFPGQGSSSSSAMRGPVLRSQDRVYRTAALHLAAAGAAGSGSIWRFVFTLDGSGGMPPPQKPPFAPRGERVPEYAGVSGGDVVPAGEAGSPRLVYHGRSRVVVWDQNVRIRYTWDEEKDGPLWFDASSPVPVPAEGGNLRWIVERDGAVQGPFLLDCEALPRVSGGNGSGASGCFAFRRHSSGAALPPSGPWDGWLPVSGLYDTGDGFSFPSFDVCDGEDLEWCFLTAEGAEKIHRADRLAPGIPGLSVPGGWTRGPLILQPLIQDDDEHTIVHMRARVDYESGMTEIKTGTGSLSTGGRQEYAEVTVEAFLEDPAGNRGPRTSLRFVIDPLSVYLSIPGTGEGGHEAAEGESGGRDA
ncbi:MAG: hypothetical protein LBG42_08095, partial [Treponema sp.]|nr:hypothetical protein [Treponema sp.]